MEHAFVKVCEVFGIESLNKHQEDAIKYVVQEKKDVFVNLPTGIKPCRWFILVCSPPLKKI